MDSLFLIDLILLKQKFPYQPCILYISILYNDGPWKFMRQKCHKLKV